MSELLPEDEIRLSQIYERLRLLVGQPDQEKAESDALHLFVEAAEICEVPADIVEAFLQAVRTAL